MAWQSGRWDSPTLSPSKPGEGWTDQARVLLVEDDADGRLDLAVLLRGAGLAVDEAVDDVTANILLDSHDFDVAVVDRGLPDGDGAELVRRRRGIGWSVPVLFLTARARG